MSEIKFNSFNDNYNIFKKEESVSKQEEKAPVLETHQGSAFSVAPEKMISAMEMLGAQNLASVTKNSQVNPKDFLSDDRIASIEESMKFFEQGVEKYAGAVDKEFGGALGEKAVYALAAEAFAKEN